MNSMNQFLASIHPALADLTSVPLVVFLVVVSLTLIFLVGYFIKGFQVFWQLQKVVRAVKLIQLAGVMPVPGEIGKHFKWEPLRHLWDVYAGTLHEVRGASSGGVVLIEMHSTVPAESIFTREVLVDSRLFDDFTRHLPGVLTGLGIIGTFAGLLDGLKHFDPSTTAKAVQGLGPLMVGVQHAFVASGVAITCAMLVVFLSRLVLAYLYRLVEQLTHSIDSLYKTGAGEKYLDRLVRASERNEANTAQLKDALVEDLNKMMTNLVDKQIAAHQAATHSLGEHIGQSITSAIAEPIKSMKEVMEATSRGNGEQVNSMLESLLTGFMAKLEDTFGSQMRGINEQMKSSMDSMSTVQASLQGLLTDITLINEHAAKQMNGTLEETMRKAADNQQLLTDQMREFVQDFRNLIVAEQNKSTQVLDDAVMKVMSEVTTAMVNLEGHRKNAAEEESDRNNKLGAATTDLVGGLASQVGITLGRVTEQVNGTLEAAMKKSADNQQLLTDQMREFVQDFRKLVSDEQNKSRQIMDEAVMKVLGEVATAMGNLDELRKNASAEESDRNNKLGAATTGLLGGLTTQVETLLSSVTEQVNKTQQNIDALGQVSLRAIDGMNQGALTMGTAAQRFESAGSSVTTVFDRSTSVAEKMHVTATSLQSAATAVQRGFEQYDSTRKIVDAQVASLMGLIESAKKESGVSQELLASMKASAEAMKRAEADARDHLDSVNDALKKAFTDFGNSLVSQVKNSIAETDRHLAQGAGHLNGVVQELATAVQRMKRA